MTAYRGLIACTCLTMWVSPLTAQRDGEATRRGQPAAPAAPVTFAFSAADADLQAGLDYALSQPPFRALIRQGALSVVLVDLSDPTRIRYSGHDADRMRYAASLPKIGILLGVFDQIDRGNLEYTPALRSDLALMIRNSSNQKSSELIRRVGFENIARTLRQPRYDLYSEKRNGGLWVGRGYGGMGVWRRDPIAALSHGANARQVARFLVMMDRGELVSPWASAEMKTLMGDPAIHHKFVAGLDARPGSAIFRKSGTWSRWHSDAALVERDGKKYVAVALMEVEQNRHYLSDLIVALDDLIFRPRTLRSVGGPPQ